MFTFYTPRHEQVLMKEGIMTMPRKMSEVVLGACLFTYLFIYLLCIIILKECLGVYIAFPM